MIGVSFFTVVGFIMSVGYFVLTIYTAPGERISEPQKYFFISMLFYIILFAYIELVVKKKRGRTHEEI